MLHHEFAPPDALRERIKCFWYNRRDFGERETRFEVLPDGYAEIIFHFGGTCSITYDGSSQPLPSPFIMGLLDQPVILSASNRFEVIGIRCFPWTIFDVLGVPSAKDSVRILVHPIAQLQPALDACLAGSRIDDAIELVGQYLLTAQQPVDGDRTISDAGAAMNDANGTLPVSDVAAAAHATVRTLERKFKQSSGYTVKDVSGLMRFEQVRNRLFLKPKSNLADLAHELGYADQSHLSREFKRYSGMTPSAFARRR